jgi:type I restriction enzyme S subunit
MDQLTTRITSGSRDWSSYYVDEGSGTFIMAQNVRPGRLDLSFRQHVCPPVDDSSRQRSQIEPDDLLVTIVGANTGDVCRVTEPLPEHYVCQSVALMRPVIAQVSAFIDTYMNSDENGQRQYRRYVYGAGRPHLDFEQLKMTPILLPPLSEQCRIRDEIERRLSTLTEIETEILTNLTRAERLRQSILKCAFDGKLVSQDPSDEPASVLLERIRAERTVRVELKNRTQSSRYKRPTKHPITSAIDP